MARLFQALVVLGGSLAGCGGRTGSDVGRTNNEGADTHDEANTGSTKDVASDQDVAPAETQTVDMSTNVAHETTGTEPSSHIIATPTNAPVAPPGDTTIALDSDTSTQSLPDSCPAEAWQCDNLRSCRADSAPACGEAWNGDIESCPFPLDFVHCVCAEAGAPEGCEEGQVRTCLHGETVSPEGRTQMLHIACECLPIQETCESVCSEHSSGVGGGMRACVETPGLVLCGGCIWAGILR